MPVTSGWSRRSRCRRRRCSSAPGSAGAAAEAAALAEVDRTRTALLAAVGHDLRTPLAAAKAAVSSLRSEDVTLDHGDRGELLATADESLDRLAGLVDNLLDMSRLQAGAMSVHPQPTAVDEVLARALDDLAPAGRRVRVDLPDDLPAATADPGLLERVLANVVDNALRYSPPERPPALTGRRLGDRVEIRVVDHGPGIPAAATGPGVPAVPAARGHRQHHRASAWDWRCRAAWPRRWAGRSTRRRRRAEG